MASAHVHECVCVWGGSVCGGGQQVLCACRPAHSLARARGVAAPPTCVAPAPQSLLPQRAQRLTCRCSRHMLQRCWGAGGHVRAGRGGGGLA